MNWWAASSTVIAARHENGRRERALTSAPQREAATLEQAIVVATAEFDTPRSVSV